MQTMASEAFKIVNKLSLECIQDLVNFRVSNFTMSGISVMREQQECQEFK